MKTNKLPKRTAPWVTAFKSQHDKLNRPAANHRMTRLGRTMRTFRTELNRRGLVRKIDMTNPPHSNARHFQKRIRRATPAKAKANRAYKVRAAAFLKELGNTFCHCCIARNCVAKPKPSEQVHHQRGRLGSLLLDERFWIPICEDCHDWCHNREPALAASIGMMAGVGEWNRSLP